MSALAAPAVLALDIGGTKLAAGIGRSDGEITRAASEPTRAGEGAADVLRRAIALAEGCRDAERADGGDVAGVGVSTMGLTRDTHVDLAPNVLGWHELRIPGALADAFPGTPVAIANDVKVATEAELRWGALRDVSDGIYLNLGTGVAAGIVTSGRVVEGAHGAAGEVGYTVADDGDERPMAADGAVPFEEYHGGAGAARRLRADPALPSTVADVAARAGDGDPAAQAFLDDLWAGIARLAGNLCVALDPAVLAVGGGYVRGESGVLQRIAAVVARAVPYPPRVTAARFGADASLRGAAALALAAIEN